jgi:hypothetical protein
MIRRLKKDVLNELPQKRRQKIEILTDDKIIEQIALLLKTKKLNNFDTSFFHNSNKNHDWQKKEKKERNNSNVDVRKNEDNDFQTVMKAYKLTGHAKLKGICEYISVLIKSKKKINKILDECKFLIFAHHLNILDAIEEVVKKNDVKYVRIDGSTKNEQRLLNIDIFQKDNACRIAILSIMACATGITMSKASTVVFAEMCFTPAVMIQAEDRAHRIGQEHSCVNIHYLFGPKTLDEVIYPNLQEKHSIVTEMLDNEKLFMHIKKIVKGRIGDFEVITNNFISKNEENDVNSSNIRNSQFIAKKIVKGNWRIDDFFRKSEKKKCVNIKTEEKVCNDKSGEERFYLKEQPDVNLILNELCKENENNECNKTIDLIPLSQNDINKFIDDYQSISNATSQNKNKYKKTGGNNHFHFDCIHLVPKDIKTIQESLIFHPKDLKSDQEGIN